MTRTAAAAPGSLGAARAGGVWVPRFDGLHPAFRPFEPAARRFASAPEFPPVEGWNAALDDLSPRAPDGAALRFVPEVPRATRRARRTGIRGEDLYDGRIVTQRQIPSRGRSWHDFLNMLVWATFPAAKWALHRRQHALVSARITPGATTLPGARTREQDAIAMLDEGGLLLVAEASAVPDAERAIAAGDERSLHALVERGALRPLVFGHAVLEHLVTGSGPVRAFPVVLGARGAVAGGGPRGEAAFADAELARRLADPGAFRAPGRAKAVDVGWLPLDAR